MPLGAGGIAVLEALGRPALVIDAQGFLVAANRRACALLPDKPCGQSIGSLAPGDPEGVRRFVDRCRGSAGELVGAVILGADGGLTRRHRCRGARVPLEAGSGVLLILEGQAEERFVALSRKVIELHDEVHARSRAEAVLSESLHDRDLLLRELQHRVKNNVQMLAGLLQGAGRETGSPEARTVLRDIARRFEAVGAVQQLVYEAKDLGTVDGADLIEAVTRSVASLAQGNLHLDISAEPVALPIEAAVPVALILNELVTNAVKYGRPSTGQQCVAVSWHRQGDRALLEVQDNGPGFVAAEASRRASGLGLVRGLLRQIGGSLVTTTPSGQPRGALCTVQFPETLALRSRDHTQHDDA